MAKSLNGRVVEKRLMKERQEELKIMKDIMDNEKYHGVRGARLNVPKKLAITDRKLKVIDRSMKKNLQRIDEKEDKIMTRIEKQRSKLENRAEKAKTEKSKKKINTSINKVEDTQSKYLALYGKERDKVMKKRELKRELVYL